MGYLLPLLADLFSHGGSNTMQWNPDCPSASVCTPKVKSKTESRGQTVMCDEMMRAAETSLTLGMIKTIQLVCLSGLGQVIGNTRAPYATFSRPGRQCKFRLSVCA